MLPTSSWRPVAAYFYLLHLDGPGLAWEYLRRNPRYQSSWAHRPSSPTAKQWGLRWLEDPALDARAAQPVWIEDPVNLTRLTRDARDSGERFGFWKLPGRKRLVHDGASLLMTGRAGGGKLRMAFERNIRDDSPFAYLIAADSKAPLRWRAVTRQRLQLASNACGAALAAPDRVALMHMRSIQAMDGRQVGASQRAIAEAVFGTDAVEQRWLQDGELRAQVRHLLRRGQQYVDGGYPRLLARNA